MAEVGVFETVRCVGGVLVAWPAHLARLEAACAWLGVPLPEDVRGISVPGDAKVNVFVWRDRWELRTGPLPVPALPVGLDLASRPAGPNAVKHTDRAGWEPDGVERLWVQDGVWTETTRANLFVVRGGALWTHPLDGRILPGVTRARVLTEARRAGLTVVEAPVRFGPAEEVFVTSALRLVAPVTRIGGAVYPGWGPISRLLAARLGATLSSGPSA